MHTLVAIDKKAEKLNGFHHCMVLRNNNSVLINKIREEYINNKKE
jgi:hypothetical protein